MSNRRYYNQQFTLVPMKTDIFARVTFGAAGAPTLDIPNSRGVVSVTRNSTGNLTFVFGTTATPANLDSYNELKMAKVVFDESGTSAAPAAPGMYITNDSVANSALCSLTVQHNAAGTATDPASGEIAKYEFTFKNSNVAG